MVDPADEQPAGELPSPTAAVPAPVLTAVILLCVGGTLTVLYALADTETGSLLGALLPPWALGLYGLLYVGLGWGVYRRRGWARRTVLVLCGIGIALGLVRLVTVGPAAAAEQAAWPVVYGILLNTESARSWFRRE